VPLYIILDEGSHLGNPPFEAAGVPSPTQTDRIEERRYNWLIFIVSAEERGRIKLEREVWCN